MENVGEGRPFCTSLGCYLSQLLLPFRPKDQERFKNECTHIRKTTESESVGAVISKLPTTKAGSCQPFNRSFKINEDTDRDEEE